MWKKYGKAFKKKIERKPGRYTSDYMWTETQEFWLIFGIPALWPLALPSYIIWQLLERIYNKFNKNSNNEEN
jgi:hypothetical protein